MTFLQKKVVVTENWTNQKDRNFLTADWLVFRKKDLYLIITQKLTFMKSGGFQVKSGFHRWNPPWNPSDLTGEIDFERPIARNGKPYVYFCFHIWHVSNCCYASCWRNIFMQFWAKNSGYARIPDCWRLKFWIHRGSSCIGNMDCTSSNSWFLQLETRSNIVVVLLVWHSTKLKLPEN